MKKLLQINTVANWGSTGRIAEEIGITAIHKGWESYIAYGRYSKESKSKLIKIGTRWDVIVHGLISRLFDMHGLGSKDATIRLVENIENIKPDLIHLHNIHGYYLNYNILFNYLSTANIPIVWTLHDCWSFTGHCTYFDYIGCKKWEIQCHNCPQIKSYPESLFIDRSKENFNLKKALFKSVNNLTIVPVSDWLSQVINKSFLSSYPIQTIYNGISLDTFSPIDDTKMIKVKYNINNRNILLGVATSWSSRKSLDDYIKLSSRLSTDYVIILIGLSQKQIKTLPNNIIGIPRTENIQELAKLYSAADIVLNLSVEETFGLTTVEGFACGTPGIVYNCTASPELITKETGLVVEKNNITALKNAIFEIISNGKNHYSSACRERAVNHYNKEDRYNEYIQLYNKILNQQ